MDGTVVRCSSYGYQYAFMPEAVLFAKYLTFDGKSVSIFQMMVEGEIYDVLVR